MYIYDGTVLRSCLPFCFSHFVYAGYEKRSLEALFCSVYHVYDNDRQDHMDWRSDRRITLFFIRNNSLVAKESTFFSRDDLWGSEAKNCDREIRA